MDSSTGSLQQLFMLMVLGTGDGDAYQRAMAMAKVMVLDKALRAASWLAREGTNLVAREFKKRTLNMEKEREKRRRGEEREWYYLNLQGHMDDTGPHVAIVWHLCHRAPEMVRNIVCKGKDVYISECQGLELQPGLFCDLETKTNDADKRVHVDIWLKSEDRKQLTLFKNDCTTAHHNHCNGLLDNSLWIFERNKFGYFDKRPFESNRSLDNIFLSHGAMDELRRRIHQFEHEPQLYQRTGSPRMLGILLHGPPGTGKTSTIKALANSMKRHIVILRPEVMTKAELRTALFDSEIVLQSNTYGTVLTLQVPIHKRLFVFEDIDATHAARRLFTPRTSPSDKDDDTDIDDRHLSLADFLNVIDGVDEIPGRIIVTTTNHPENLDPAVIRQGRLGDVQIQLGKMDAAALNEMLRVYCGSSEPDVPSELADKWTPAQAASIIANAGMDRTKAIHLLSA